MKPTKEWVEKINLENRTPEVVIEEACSNPLTILQVKQIQLDAYKQGMSDAAEVVSYATLSYEDEHYKAAGEQLEEAILTARDNKKEI